VNMLGLNKVFVMGNLTRDPELRYTPNGQGVANFGVATNRRWTTPEGEKRDEVEFHNIVVWGRQAEVINQYLKKGNPIFIEGRLKTQNWEGQDGVRRNRTEVVVESFQFIGSGGGNRNQDQSSDDQGYSQQSGQDRPFSNNQNSMPSAPADTASQVPNAPSTDAKQNDSSDTTAPKLDEDINIEDIPF